MASDSIINVANPNIADVAAASDAGTAIGTTTANQLWRLRSNTTGLLLAADSATYGSFAVTRKYDVTAGTTYTFHIYNTAPGWQIYSVSQATPRVQFFNTDGSFHSEILTGFTAPSPYRYVTFTVPTGAEKVAFNLRNPDIFSNSDPMTEAALQAVIDNTMLEVGSSVDPFVAYNTDPFTMTESRFTAGTEGDIKVTLQDEFVYFKTACQQSTVKDIIWRFRFDYGTNYFRTDSRSGVVDPYGARFVTAGTNVALPSDFNLSTQVHCTGGDESCPEKRNGMFVDGGHGSTCYQITATSHGKANVDVGSIWSDGTDQWIILYIESTDIVVMQRRYTGTDTKWSISSSAPGSSTFTHVSGATNTGNITVGSSAQYQFVPIISEYTTRLVVGGTKVTTDGDYAGDTAWIDEGYVGLNIAKVQDALIAAVGASSPNWTPDVPQVRRYNRYEFNKYGAWTVYGSHYTVEPYTRSAGIDYFGGIQLQRLSLDIDSTAGMQDAVELYIPDVGTVGSYTFKNKADITSNASSVDIVASDCDDAADLPTTFCLLGKSSGSYVGGQAFGFDPAVGAAVPATLAANTNYVFNLSTADKCYPKLVDSTAGDAAADDVFQFDGFRAPFLPTDTDLTIPGVIYHSRGNARCIIAAHKTLTAKAVTVPSEYSGYAVTILRGSGMTLDNGFVRDGVITVSVSGSHGWAVLALG